MPTDVSSDAPADRYDRALRAFSRARHHNARLLDAVAGRWSVAASDIRALGFIAERGTPTPRELADHLGVTTGAVTSMLDRIERAGLANRTPHSSDRRSIRLELTDRGREAVDDASAHYRRVFAAAIDGPDLPRVTEAFARLAAGLSAEADAVSGREI